MKLSPTTKEVAMPKVELDNGTTINVTSPEKMTGVRSRMEKVLTGKTDEPLHDMTFEHKKGQKVARVVINPARVVAIYED
jgi:hypothetical protein